MAKKPWPNLREARRRGRVPSGVICYGPKVSTGTPGKGKKKKSRSGDEAGSLGMAVKMSRGETQRANTSRKERKEN